MDFDQGLVGPVRSEERLLELCWWNVAEVAVQAIMVVPVHPAQRGELDIVDGLPRASVAGRATQAWLPGGSGRTLRQLTRLCSPWAWRPCFPWPWRAALQFGTDRCADLSSRSLRPRSTTAKINKPLRGR